jgi:hypothetical protein
MTEYRLQKTLLEWRDVDGEIIALDRGHASYLAPNASGALLWRALHTGSTEPALAELLVSEYGLCHEQARADVAVFVADLDRRGLLEAR